jgi:pimeloyl-ACP methyl ester carboxylesterase
LTRKITEPPVYARVQRGRASIPGRDPGNLFDLTVEQRWEAWRAVSCPVLLVRGDDSDVLAAGTAQRMLAENPHASMAGVPDCGHFITLDNPDGMLEVVSPWLAAAEAGQAASA